MPSASTSTSVASEAKRSRTTTASARTGPSPQRMRWWWRSLLRTALRLTAAPAEPDSARASNASCAAEDQESGSRPLRLSRHTNEQSGRHLPHTHTRKCRRTQRTASMGQRHRVLNVPNPHSADELPSLASLWITQMRSAVMGHVCLGLSGYKCGKSSDAVCLLRAAVNAPLIQFEPNTPSELR